MTLVAQIFLNSTVILSIQRKLNTVIFYSELNFGEVNERNDFRYYVFNFNSISYPYGLYISFFKGFGWLVLALVFPPYPVIVGLMHMFS